MEKPNTVGTGPMLDLPQALQDELSADQYQAIRSALASQRWKIHPVDIRITIPFIDKSFYFTVIAGEEGRLIDRRRIERAHHPVGKIANILFLAGIATLLGLTAFFAVVINSQLVEF